VLEGRRQLPPAQAFLYCPTTSVTLRTLNDKELIEKAGQGDYAAFEEIVKRFHARVYRLAYGMLHSKTDAEEVTQETFLNIFSHLRDFRGDSSPSSWIFRIAANAALMRLRRHRRKPTQSIDETTPLNALWPVGKWAMQPDDQLLNQELGKCIENAVVALPEKYRLVLLLRDVEGQTNEEVAHSLGLSVASVKSRLHRSRMHVRQAVEQYFEGGTLKNSAYSKG
jgi:RNA polymerase sigma-70 factor, ECF subfamily